MWVKSYFFIVQRHFPDNDVFLGKIIDKGKKYIIVGYMHRPYAFSFFSWEIPYYNPSLVLETSIKSGNLPGENQCFSTFQIPLEPC